MSGKGIMWHTLVHDKYTGWHHWTPECKASYLGVSVDYKRELADLIHEEMCSRTQPCGYGSAALPYYYQHTQYYDLRAKLLIEQLEPEIGIANIGKVVRVVISELM